MRTLFATLLAVTALEANAQPFLSCFDSSARVSVTNQSTPAGEVYVRFGDKVGLIDCQDSTTSGYYDSAYVCQGMVYNYFSGEQVKVTFKGDDPAQARLDVLEAYSVNTTQSTYNLNCE